MPNLKSSILAVFLFAIRIDLSNSYVAVGRSGTAAVLVGTKIYIQGGYTSVLDSYSGPPTNDMLILPMDQSFNLSNPPWDPLSGTLPGPALVGTAAAPGGYNNTVIYFFGGQYITPTFNNDTNMLWTFNTTNNTWAVSSTPFGAPPPAVDSHSSVSRLSDSSLWIFGGEDATYNNTKVFAATYRLTTYPTLAWSLVGGYAPSGGRQAHTANMLSDGRMVILGGKNLTNYVYPFSEVLVFDTGSGVWSMLNVSLSNGSPVPRLSHVAVVTRDDRIIIQGGDLGPLVGVSGVADIGVLDMKASNLSWYIPSTAGPAASPRVAHSAVIVGTIAFILFGQTDNTTVDNNIYALDTNTWTWLSTYNPSHLEYTDTGNIAPIPTSNDTVPEKPIPTYTVIIIAVSAGVVALLLIAAVVCCIVYNRRKNKKTDAAADAVATTNAALSLGNPQLPVTQVKNENTSQRNSIASWPSRSQNGGYDSDNLMRSPHSANTNISTPSNNTSYRLSYPPAGPVFHPATTPMYVVDPNVPNVQNMPYAPAAYGHPGYPNGAGMVSPVVYNPYPSYAPFYGYPVGHPSSVPLSMAPSDGGRYFPPNAMSPTLQSTSSQHTSSPEQRHESEHRESAGSSVDTTSTVPIVSGVPVVSNVRSSLTEPYRGEGDEREERL